MFQNLHYVYIALDTLLLTIWLIFYLVRKDLRHEILMISILTIPLGLTQYFFGQDYWHPTYIMSFNFFGLEDLLYAFGVGGIAGVIYEEFLGKRFTKRHLPKHQYIATALTLGGLLALFVGVNILHINSIYVSSVVFLLAGLGAIIMRHDLFKQAFYSGVFLGVLTLLSEIFVVFLFPDFITKWWFLDNISRVFILEIPVEEILFAFALGFVTGPIYELVFGLRLQK